MGDRDCRWTKKPVTIEAVRLTAADFNWTDGWDGLPFEPLPQWVIDAVEAGVLVPGTPRHTDYAEWRVTTLEGEHWGTPGDWLIRGVKGELYFCKPDIFDATYSRAPQVEQPGSEVEEARKALRCLYIAVPENVARDVSEKVEAAFAALSAPKVDLPYNELTSILLAVHEGEMGVLTAEDQINDLLAPRVEQPHHPPGMTDLMVTPESIDTSGAEPT